MHYVRPPQSGRQKQENRAPTYREDRASIIILNGNLGFYFAMNAKIIYNKKNIENKGVFAWDIQNLPKS